VAQPVIVLVKAARIVRGRRSVKPRAAGKPRVGGGKSHHILDLFSGEILNSAAVNCLDRAKMARQRLLSFQPQDRFS
jgi:hypothetical protein